MKDYIRIYYHAQCIFFANNAQECIQQHDLKNVWVIRSTQPDVQMKNIFGFLDSCFTSLIIEGTGDHTFEKVKEHFKTIVAGGGVVWNEMDELLMIYRLGKWDLPKGKIEQDEEIHEGALREVSEETNVRNIIIRRFLKTTYHIYMLKGEWILKQTEWFEMYAKKQSLIPQEEEDIQEAVWVDKGAFQERLQNSYPNILYLLQDL